LQRQYDFKKKERDFKLQNIGLKSEKNYNLSTILTKLSLKTHANHHHVIFQKFELNFQHRQFTYMCKIKRLSFKFKLIYQKIHTHTHTQDP
jgi:hypothetical protein